jgi:hypothetical protein
MERWVQGSQGLSPTIDSYYRYRLVILYNFQVAIKVLHVQVDDEEDWKIKNKVNID